MYWYESVAQLIAGEGAWSRLPYFDLEMHFRRSRKSGDTELGLPAELAWLRPKVVGERWHKFLDSQERPDAYWCWII